MGYKYRHSIERVKREINDMNLTKNFNVKEFDCKDGSNTPPDVRFNLQVLANNLQVLRDHIDMPIHINSGYRSPSYNERIGGVKNSQHLLGNAADITTKKYSSGGLAAVIEKLIEEGKMKQGGLGIYPGFVHYDIRETKARW